MHRVVDFGIDLKSALQLRAGLRCTGQQGQRQDGDAPWQQ
jgi:hypothetical protein